MNRSAPLLAAHKGQDQPITAVHQTHSAAANRPFKLQSGFSPAGDQPAAIKDLRTGIDSKMRDQVLLGVTGSGKTFTMAHVIAELNRPSLIMAPNKTLAAQLYGEMKSFFPDNSVEYFVSYYDYYQPEAYVPNTDTYIEKESSINEQIDRMRHSATRALLERRDVVIVASVSCIYGIGAVETYSRMVLDLEKNQKITPDFVIRSLSDLHYQRNQTAFFRGTFRVRGDLVELFPAHLDNRAWRFSFFDDVLEQIIEVDPLTGERTGTMEAVRIYPNSHYVTTRPSLKQAIESIRRELPERLKELKTHNQLLEAQRLEQRVKFDLEMLEATGMCAGIENYSRHLTGRKPGEPPPTLFEYLPPDALLFVDESHVSVPQIGGMFRGDYARKSTLSNYGFRLPSCVDNRPLKFEEWDRMRPQTIYVSATPGPFELKQTEGVFVEQIVRPTGLVDPQCELRPTEGQIDDLMHECRGTIADGNRVLVTTLTKQMAEDLSEYFTDAGLKTRYLHSDVNTLERIQILQDLRLGVFDILIGINLLREGLDIPECALVAILDADKEGFLRSKTSLVQTIGRAARNVRGRVLLFGDKMTESLEYAIGETERRRARQIAYNKAHGITPASIRKQINDLLDDVYGSDQPANSPASPSKKAAEGLTLRTYLDLLDKQMRKLAGDLEFEEAARLRDEISRFDGNDLGRPAITFAIDPAIVKTYIKPASSGKTRKNRQRHTR